MAERFLMSVLAAAVLCEIAGAATHYVDATNGLDTNGGHDPNAPWQTLTKVENHTFAADDQCLFKCGEHWVGAELMSPDQSFYVPAGGSVGHPVIFGSYGAGARPILDANGAANTTILIGVGKGHKHFENLDIRGSKVQGLYTIDHDITCSDCRFGDNTEYGYNHSTWGDGLLEDCIFEANSSGVSCNSGTLTIRRCTAQDNLSDGFDIAGSSAATIEYCLIQNNGVDGIGGDGDGISFHATSTGTIRYCWIADNWKTCICNIDTTNVTTYANVCIAKSNATIGALYVSRGVTYNNTIYCSATNGNGIQIVAGTGGTHTSRNNIIFGFDVGINTINGTVDTDYDDVYGSVTPYHDATPGLHSLSVDPKFNDDFTLQQDSPCIGKGVNLGYPYDVDYAGQTRSQLWEMGAFEFFPSGPEDCASCHGPCGRLN